MHIEPGIVDGAKLALSYVTAAGAFAWGARMALSDIRNKGGLPAFAARSAIATVLVLSFFQLLPHQSVGVSEVHLILGSTLLLLFGTGAAGFGLAAGLLLQGLFFAPSDLLQYSMNVTTLIVPLLGIHALAKRIIAPKTAYVDLQYRQALTLSAAYQGGIVAWVAFWALYGQGMTAGNLANVTVFGVAYMSVVILEPLVDLAVLAVAKQMRRFSDNALFDNRLHAAT